jgi:hypothetical protein
VFGLAVTHEAFTQLIDKAVEDPEFAKRLVADPGLTAGAEGVELPGEVVESLKGANVESHGEIVENLQARMSRMLGYLH